ncbi:hypothetical protein E2542_SST28960 [Spatholobus suberectus]|nr:hypothetical protein E2542_SST28960 [Spatholobus suberectus]
MQASASQCPLPHHCIDIPQASLHNRKMASTLPNMSFYAHTSSSRTNKFSNVKLLPLSSTRNRTFRNNVKAMAGGEASLHKSKQQQPKMKVPQASPKVIED